MSAPCELCGEPTDGRPSVLCCLANHPGYQQEPKASPVGFAQASRPWWPAELAEPTGEEAMRGEMATQTHGVLPPVSLVVAIDPAAGPDETAAQALALRPDPLSDLDGIAWVERADGGPGRWIQYDVEAVRARFEPVCSLGLLSLPLASRGSTDEPSTAHASTDRGYEPVVQFQTGGSVGTAGIWKALGHRYLFERDAIRDRSFAADPEPTPFRSEPWR